MEVLVPYASEEPKTRLAGVLEPDERAAFARAMLADVLEAVRSAGHQPRVLATGAVDVDAPMTVDDRSLSEAVNAQFGAAFDSADAATDRLRTGAVAVVMADLALATPAAIDRLCDTQGDVVLAPGRGAGTNAIVTRHPDFRVDYHGTSYLDHRANAAEVGAESGIVDSFRLATDVDERADLVEVLVHGDGRSRAFLEQAGFALETTGGRVTVSR